jgi:hypothetical protein
VLNGIHDLPLYYWAIFLAVCFAFWSMASMLFSVVSGWHGLIERFRQQPEDEPSGDTLEAGPFSHTVTMRSLGVYPGLIRMTSAKDALYLSVIGLCRVGHPPLRIPWQEIRLSERNTLFGWRMILTLGQDEQVPLRISARTARKLGLI